MCKKFLKKIHKIHKTIFLKFTFLCRKNRSKSQSTKDVKRSRKRHHISESEEDNDIIEVEESPPVKLKKTIKQKKSRNISQSLTSSAGGKKKHILSSEESDIASEGDLSGSEYLPSEPLDSYYDEDTVVVESPKCKKETKKHKI